MVTGATDGCQITPSIFSSYPHHILWPSCHPGPPAEGALTPTSPEPVTAAASKPVQGRAGGQQLSSRHKSLSVSRNPLPVLSPQSASVFSFAPSPLTSAHPPPEFLWTGIWTAPPLALLPLGPPIRWREDCQTPRHSVSFKHTPAHKPGSL